MNSSYIIVKSFLKSSVFESPNTPEIFFNEQTAVNLETTVDVNSKVGNDTSIYLVDLHVDMNQRLNDDLEIFNLSLIYCTMINILDKNIKDDELRHILQVEVPQNMYDSVRALIWEITRESGFPPIMMKDFSFVAQNSDTEIHNDISINEKNTNEIITDSIVDYSWLLDDFNATEEGAKFMDIYTTNICDPNVYEDQPMYKYYLRFLRPIEYKHPQYEECAKSFWPLFFQLLVGNDGVQYDIIQTDAEELDIKFTYMGYCNRLISDLTLNEVKELASGLFIDMMTDIAVDMYSEEFDSEYADSLLDDKLVLKEEFLTIYNCQTTHGSDMKSLVERLYSKIKECDLKTFVYRM